MKHIITLLFLLATSAAFADTEVTPYIGGGHATMTIEQEHTTGSEYFAGVQLDQSGALEVSKQSLDGATIYSAQVIGDVFTVYRNSLTWQIGGDTIKLQGDPKTHGFWHYGIGWQWQIVKPLTIRAQYNVNELRGDLKGASSHTISASAQYNF